MKKVRLEIVGLSYSQTQSGAYALVLGESSGSRRLPIIIGGFEAQAIAIELEKMSPSRPLTHDLFKAFAQTFNITVNEVLIYNLVEGIFYAKLICSDGQREVEIDARTSDAIALGCIDRLAARGLRVPLAQGTLLPAADQFILAIIAKIGIFNEVLDGPNRRDRANPMGVGLNCVWDCAVSFDSSLPRGSGFQSRMASGRRARQIR